MNRHKAGQHWSEAYDHLEAEDFDRAGTVRNRPRTKKRPRFEDARSGMVIAVDRGRYRVALDEDDGGQEFTATRSSSLRKLSIVTGDRVDAVGDMSGDEGTLGRIVRRQKRKNVLRRSADDSDQFERITVANADQMLIVLAAQNPPPRAGLLDRYLIAAFDAGIEPIVYISKTDLADPAEFLAKFSCLDLTILTGSMDEPPLTELQDLLSGQVTVAVGHSGVGKSTLVNLLVPDADRATGEVNVVTGRGRHTSSSTVSLRLPDDTGWIIDTPGVRSFGLGHVASEQVLAAFVSHLKSYDVPEGLPHLTEAHDWEIVDRIRAGELGDSGRARLESLLTIVENLGETISGTESEEEDSDDDDVEELS